MGSENRRSPRIAVNLSATMMYGFTTDVPVLIIDISKTGAKVGGAELPVGLRVSVEHKGDWVQGRVMWSEEDRFGLRFDTPLRIGLLYDHAIRSAAAVAPAKPSQQQRPPRPNGFGRRAA